MGNNEQKGKHIMNNFTSWFRGLRGRLLVMIMLPVLLMAGVSMFALNGIHEQRDDLQVIARERLKVTDLNGDMKSSMHAIGRFMWLALARNTNLDSRKQAMSVIREQRDAFRKSMDEYATIKLAERGKVAYGKLHDPWKRLQEPFDQILAHLEKFNAQDDAEVPKIIMGSYTAPALEITNALGEMDKISQEVNAEIVAKSEKNAEKVSYAVTLVSILGAIAILVIGLFTATRLANALTGLTGRISDSSTQVGAASQQLSAASQQLSAGATEGAASLEETVSSLEELSSMVKMNADNAREAAALSQSSSSSADEGEAEIQKLIGAMSEVAKGSKKIEEIINVIDDIAFQTNLLALNAAVEAARAGEQGKGFAVVADAVRTLAQRSASAAKDITSLIKDSVQKTEHGAKIADQSGVVLKNIVNSIKKVSDLNNEIASASQQQANGLGQISKAMNQLDQVTQGNAASAEEAAASSEEMSAQAVSLQGMVGELTGLIHGAATDQVRYSSAAPTYKKPTTTYHGRPASAGKPAPVVKLADHRPAAPKGADGVKPEQVIPFDDDGQKVGTTDGF